MVFIIQTLKLAKGKGEKCQTLRDRNQFSQHTKTHKGISRTIRELEPHHGPHPTSELPRVPKNAKKGELQNGKYSTSRPWTVESTIQRN